MLIPYSTAERSHSFPVVTWLAIGVSVIIFATAAYTPEGVDDLIASFGLQPVHAAWPLFFTSLFVHGNLPHLASNMAWLAVFGPAVEDELGGGLYGFFFFFAGIGGLMLELVFTVFFAPERGARYLIGCSAAVFGVLGFYLARFPRGRVVVVNLVSHRQRRMTLPAWLGISTFVLVQLWLAWKQVARPEIPVTYWAHVGGFLFGLLAAWLLRVRAQWAREDGAHGDRERALSAVARPHHR